MATDTWVQLFWIEIELMNFWYTNLVCTWLGHGVISGESGDISSAFNVTGISTEIAGNVIR